MLFNSLHFFAFYLVVLVAYFALPYRLRWPLLLAASYYFYCCWRPVYALLLVALTLVGYGVALGIEASASPTARRVWLGVGLSLCVGVLVGFKYLDFLFASASTVLAAADVMWQAPVLNLLIPVGISFHTFQSIGYMTDVYRRTLPAERHLGIYALFIVFFPQLLAGPIERSRHMLPQFHQLHSFTYDRAASGFRFILWGLIKKMMIADLLAPFVNQVYQTPRAVSGDVLLIATFFFAIQIYCDFSGYSDIAVGVARVMGYDLLINFRQPYLARSISDFWSRWHISLSTWFRDYVYIPLGGSRVSRSQWVFNVLVVFLISGLWHGASILFALWGLLHGLYLIAERVLTPTLTAVRGRLGFSDASALPACLGGLVTFGLVMIAWVPFRARRVSDAGYILTHMFRLGRFPVDSLFGFGLPRFEFVLALFMIGVLFAVEGLLRSQPAALTRIWRWQPARWAVYAGGCYAIVFFGVFDKIEFIYFQF